MRRTKFGTIKSIEKKVTVYFFRTAKGDEPVRSWLKQQHMADKKKIGQTLKLIEYSWPIGMPLVRKMSADLWEIRLTVSDKRQARVFFTILENQLILLHAFHKKTGKTPKHELNTAHDRLKQLKQGV